MTVPQAPQASLVFQVLKGTKVSQVRVGRRGSLGSPWGLVPAPFTTLGMGYTLECAATHPITIRLCSDMLRGRQGPGNPMGNE